MQDAVRVFLFAPGPDAFSVAASVHATLPETAERRVGERCVLLVDIDDPRTALARARGELDRFQPGWRELAEVDLVRA
jgi:hypothetical protein